jgi:hypothetical protein
VVRPKATVLNVELFLSFRLDVDVETRYLSSVAFLPPGIDTMPEPASSPPPAIDKAHVLIKAMSYGLTTVEAAVFLSHLEKYPVSPSWAEIEADTGINAGALGLAARELVHKGIMVEGRTWPHLRPDFPPRHDFFGYANGLVAALKGGA